MEEESVIRTEFLFDEKKENVNAFLTRAARIFGLLEHREEYEEETSEVDNWSKADIERYKDYVWRIMQPTVDEIGRYFGNRLYRYQGIEDFIANLYMNIWKNFYRYNNPKYKSSKTTEYSFHTFVSNYVAGTLRVTYTYDHGYSKRLHDYMLLVRKTKMYIAAEKNINMDDITAEEVFEVMPKVTEMPLSLNTIKKVMAAVQPKFSISNGDVDIAENGPYDEIDYGDDSLIALMEEFLNSMRPMQQFIFLQNYGFCSLKYEKMSIKEMGYDDYFVSLCREDKVGKNHICHGNLLINKPRIKAEERCEKVEIKDVDYVSEKYIRNERDRSRKKLITLVKERKIEMKDFNEKLAVYLDMVWDRLEGMRRD